MTRNHRAGDPANRQRPLEAGRFAESIHRPKAVFTVAWGAAPGRARVKRGLAEGHIHRVVTAVVNMAFGQKGTAMPHSWGVAPGYGVRRPSAKIGAPPDRAAWESPRPAAFTLVEILVVIIIIGTLIMLLLPAIQGSRERARRYQCAQSLQQLITAVHNYELAYGVYPPGTLEEKGPIQNHAFGYHHNWIVQLLPYFEQQNAAVLIDRRVGVYHRNNAEATDLEFRVLDCPSQPVSGLGYSCYAGVYHDNEAPIDKDNHGVFFLNSRVTFDDLSDGAAQTLFIGEKIVEQGDLGWMSGTRATLRNTGLPLNTRGTIFGGFWVSPRSWRKEDGTWGADDQIPEPPANQPPPQGPILPVGGFASVHPGGCQFAFGDGHVALLDESIALNVLKQLGHRCDGKLLSCDRY